MNKFVLVSLSPSDCTISIDLVFVSWKSNDRERPSRMKSLEERSVDTKLERKTRFGIAERENSSRKLSLANDGATKLVQANITLLAFDNATYHRFHGTLIIFFPLFLRLGPAYFRFCWFSSIGLHEKPVLRSIGRVTKLDQFDECLSSVTGITTELHFQIPRHEIATLLILKS